MKTIYTTLLIVTLLLTGCRPPTSTGNSNPTADNHPSDAAAPITTESAPTQAANTTDLTHLPLGDGHISTSPVVGSVWSCQTEFNSNAGGAFTNGPWIKSDGTFDLTAKPSVSGAISWPSQFTITLNGTSRSIQGNDLPKHATGQYPIASSDDAYGYDRNPNAIQSQTMQIDLPANPQLATQPSCLPMGQIGVLLTGSYFFNALDGPGRDAVAHEIQDDCQGHPEQTGAYHYHNLSDCIADPGTGHSALVGYALDGFGIFGHRGEDGHDLTNADLDACHGHTHEIEWDGQKVVMYHYHATHEYPYTVGCFMGTPVKGAQAVPGRNGNQTQPGQNGPSDACRPDLNKAAASLNISVDQLRAALGEPTPGQRPDLTSAAVKLGITTNALQQAMQQGRSADCAPPADQPKP